MATTPILFYAQLVPSNTGTHFTDLESMESWVNLGVSELDFQPGALGCGSQAISTTLCIPTYAFMAGIPSKSKKRNKTDWWESNMHMDNQKTLQYSF